jgi:molybdopterin-guanine dinucleotide biosynthesis protein A
MSDIVAFSFGRKQSARVPNKMLRPFADTTLVDIALRKLKAVDPHAFFAGYEDEFRAKCAQHGVRFVGREPNSIAIDGPITEILSFLRAVDAKYFLLVSACNPFMTVEHIERFRDRCVEGGCRPAISVKRHRKHFVTGDATALNFDRRAKTLNTKTVEPVYELVDGLYFFEKEFFFSHGTYWRWDEVRFLEVGGDDFLIDVDTEADFAVAQALWSAGVGREARHAEL